MGDSCTFSHSLYEYWLHPDRFRTDICQYGMACKRPVCFFAHCQEQLRPVDPSLPPAELCWQSGASLRFGRNSGRRGAGQRAAAKEHKPRSPKQATTLAKHGFPAVASAAGGCAPLPVVLAGVRGGSGGSRLPPASAAAPVGPPLRFEAAAAAAGAASRTAKVAGAAAAPRPPVGLLAPPPGLFASDSALEALAAQQQHQQQLQEHHHHIYQHHQHHHAQQQQQTCHSSRHTTGASSSPLRGPLSGPPSGPLPWLVPDPFWTPQQGAPAPACSSSPLLAVQPPLGFSDAFVPEGAAGPRVIYVMVPSGLDPRAAAAPAAMHASFHGTQLTAAAPQAFQPRSGRAAP